MKLFFRLGISFKDFLQTEDSVKHLNTLNFDYFMHEKRELKDVPTQSKISNVNKSMVINRNLQKKVI